MSIQSQISEQAGIPDINVEVQETQPDGEAAPQQEIIVTEDKPDVDVQDDYGADAFGQTDYADMNGGGGELGGSGDTGVNPQIPDLETFDPVVGLSDKAKQIADQQIKEKGFVGYSRNEGLLYVMAPPGLFGVKVGDNKNSILQAAAEGAGLGGSLGSIVPGVGNVIGAGVGAVVSTIGNIFTGDQGEYFDVIFRDALKKVFSEYDIDSKKLELHNGQIANQFKITKKMSRGQVQQLITKIASRVSGKMKDQKIRSALAGIQITSAPNPLENVLFAFPEGSGKFKQTDNGQDSDQDTTVGPNQALKTGITWATVAGLILAAGSILGAGKP